MPQRELSIVVPTLNEEGNIAELLRRIDRAMRLSETRYEVVFVDDHSTDKTVETILSLAERYPVSFHVKTGERGKAFSLLEGFAYVRYDRVAILDADLQYPPETLPEMLDRMDAGADIVVANRVEREVSVGRKVLSRGFALVFSRWLHGLNCDVQAGLKVFRRCILDEVRLAPSPWTFDLEFLIRARNYGYSIESVNMPFAERQAGESKIVMLKAITEIGKNALALKFASLSFLRLHPAGEGVMTGAGVAHLGKRFLTHTTLEPDVSALETFVPWQKGLLFLAVLIVVLGAVFDPLATGIVIVALLSTAYFTDMLFSIYLIGRSLRFPPEIRVEPDVLEKLKDAELPIYSVLCPLYKESEVLPGFLRAMAAIDWPKDKLEVVLLLEENDAETIAVARNMSLPSYVRVVVVPESQPKTKPKACNYGLGFVRGKYVVIYDAEDIPDPLQLKKAYVGFRTASPDVRCLQAKLNYFNPHQNILTRLFTAEYSLWFDVLLPGLQSINTVIPLGGTSNHFRRRDLLSCEGWDPFNVTEDCDLGVRMFKRGFRTAIIDSVTLEEANSGIGNWIRQRSRWIKGYMQTYLVHMREPVQFFREHGGHALLFQLMVGMRLTFLVINPILWLVTIVYFTFRATLGPSIEALYPGGVFYIAAASMIFGNFAALYAYMIGCAKRGHWSVVKYVFFIPFYWLMGSIAALMAAYQLFVKPHYWEKTRHGLHLKKTDSSTGSAIDTSTVEIANTMGTPAEHLAVDVSSVPRHILIFNWRDTRHSYAGGAEVYVHEVARQWVASGNEVTVFCGNDGHSPDEEVIDGVKVVRRGGTYLVYAWAAWYYLTRWRGRCDIILDCQNGIPFFTPLYAKEKVYCLMHHVHQEVFFHSLWLPLAWLAGFLEKRVMPIVYRHVSFVTVSDSTRLSMEMLGMGKAGIEVIHPGAYVPAGKEKKSAIPLVAYVGRLKAYKSVDVLVHAFALVVRECPDAMLVIAGDGEESERLRDLVRRLGLERRVIFLGRVSEKTKAKLLRSAWVLVNPSLMEGWGIVNIEANACGTPVVASNVSGLRDSVRHAFTGYLFPYGNKDALARRILDILEDDTLRKDMEEHAREWSKRFRWQAASEKLFHILQPS